MEHTEDMLAILDRIPNPAFIVQNGIITHGNPPALQRQIPLNGDIHSILLTGEEEYAAFTDGCLYLTVRLCDLPCSVSVTALQTGHLFILEQEDDQMELRSMALAAQALRSPLSNVMAVADQLFPLASKDDSPETQAKIARINRGLYQMLRIVGNMSDAYRYGTENVPRTELLEITGTLREIFDRAAPLIAHTGLTMTYSGPQESIFCLIDGEKVERAVNNLLSNAIKFTPHGGSIDAALVRKGKMLYLSVQNSGSGIPEKLRSAVFSRYQRQPGLEDSRFGIGLGMVLVRRAAAAHDGTVLVQEGTDFGLRITMTIPIRHTSDPSVRSPMIHVDYAGNRSHPLVEFSDCLPLELFSGDHFD